MFRPIAIVAALSCFGQTALADAIPPPAEVDSIHQALIGMWLEDTCVMPQGLGHSCLQRIYMIGSETITEAGFSSMDIANLWGTSSRYGRWTATKDGSKRVKLEVQMNGGANVDIVLQLESENAFQLISVSDDRMYPPSHFTRLGKPIEPAKD